MKSHETGFLTFSRIKERYQWHEMGYRNSKRFQNSFYVDNLSSATSKFVICRFIHKNTTYQYIKVFEPFNCLAHHFLCVTFTA